VISIQGILFLFNKERLKRTQAERGCKQQSGTSDRHTRCSVKHVCTRPIQSATALPATVHTFTPNMNKMHLQHWKRTIRTKRPNAACSWLVSGPTSDRNRGQDNNYWCYWPPSYLVNPEKFWNLSLKTDPLHFLGIPVFLDVMCLVDGWFPTFRNIVMPSSSRCFELTLEDEGTATFETSGTTHPRTSRRSHSRRRNDQLHRWEGIPSQAVSS